MSSSIDKIRGILANVLVKAITPGYANLPGAEPRTPPFNLIELYKKVGESWVMQQIFRVLVQETRRPGMSIVPRFIKKCKKDGCGLIYYTDVEECDCGSKEFETPSKGQRSKLERLILHPNNDRENLYTILGSIIYHDLTADIWFLSVDYAPLNSSLIPREIKVQDPRYIKPVLDKFDRFSSLEYFCPRCYNDPNNFDNRNRYMITVNEKTRLPIPCPSCGLEMLQTAYIQEINGEVTARWGKNQMVHGSTHRLLPGFFGEPRSKSIWNIIHILSLMDQWFFDHFSESRLEKLILIPGYNEAQVTNFINRVETEKRKLEILDSRSGETRPKRSLRQMFIGGQQGGTVLEVGIDPNKIQAMDFYKTGIQACAGLYGVQAIFIGVQQEGSTRNFTPALQMEVQERAVLEIQQDKEQVINNQLLPIFGITDWILKFNPLEKKDKLREAEIEQRMSDAATKYAALGFDISFDEQNNLKKSSKPVRQVVSTPTEDETIRTRTTGHEISPATGNEINETSTQREPHGNRPYSPLEEEKKP